MRHIGRAAASLAPLALVSCGQPAQHKAREEPSNGALPTSATGIAVEDPWIQLPAVRGRPGAAYFTLRVEGVPDKLLSVATPVAERTALHETGVEGGVTRMGPAEDLSLQPGKPLGFGPGSKHVMLFGIDSAVEAGSTVPLTFTFARTAPVTVEAKVRSFGKGHVEH